MRKNHIWRRGISLFLSLAMLITVLPTTALAAELSEAPATEAQVAEETSPASEQAEAQPSLEETMPESEETPDERALETTAAQAETASEPTAVESAEPETAEPERVEPEAVPSEAEEQEDSEPPSSQTEAAESNPTQVPEDTEEQEEPSDQESLTSEDRLEQEESGQADQETNDEEPSSQIAPPVDESMETDKPSSTAEPQQGEEGTDENLTQDETAAQEEQQESPENQRGEEAESSIDLSSEQKDPFADYTQEGDWWYEVREDYAVLHGYSGNSSVITIPMELGGYPVTRIEGTMLLPDTKVTSVEVHGNIISISGVAFANAQTLTLRGYNGTYVLSYAQLNQISCDNLSSVQAEGFTEDTVDYSYAQAGHITIVSDEAVIMDPAEAAVLHNGTTIYLPKQGGMGGKVYRVVSIEWKNGQAELGVVPVKSSLEDEHWIYKIEQGYAVVLGYDDTIVTKLAIPSELGGYPVNGIGDKAFAQNTQLTQVRVHGNVVHISDTAFDGIKVKLLGYNGTEVLQYAKNHNLTSENLTSLDNFILKDPVIDYSYADMDRFQYDSATSIRIRPAEAAQLDVGDMFYLPKRYGDLVVIYKVTRLTVGTDWVTVTVEEASAEECLIEITMTDTQLTPDWAGAQWAEGVEIVQEKIGGSFSLGGQVSLKYDKTLKTFSDGTKLKFSASGSLGVSGTVSIDYKIWGNELQTCKFVVDPNFQMKGTLSLSGGTDSDQNLYTKFESIKKEGSDFEVYLGSIPLVSVAGVATVQMATYLKLSVEGEISLTFKAGGELGAEYNKSKGSFEGINEFKVEPVGVEIKGNLEFGPAEAAELTLAIVGRVVSIDLFGGVTASASYSTEKSHCIAIQLGAKIELSLTAELKISEKLKGSVTLLDLHWNLDLLHYEVGKGFVPNCTYGTDYTVKFNTAYDKLDDVIVKEGSKLTQPTISAEGHEFLGWYTDKELTHPWDFENDTVQSDMVLYAKWDSNYFTVHYKVNYEKEDFTATVSAGELIPQPSSPMWMDHVFEGWYQDEALTEPWNFNSDVMPTGDLTLYGKWREEPGYNPYEVNSVSSGEMSYGGHTYTHYATYMSYSEARAFCESMGGYLITITSQGEQDAVSRYVNGECAQQYVWLGINSTGNWNYWLNGEKVSYTNWNSGSAPTVSAAQYNGAMRVNGGKWDALDNGATAHVVCEWGSYAAEESAPATTDGITYAVDESTGQAYVTGYYGQESNLQILENYQGYPVTAIAANAFQNNQSLVSIQIPNSVTEIGSNAFKDCTSLATVSLPDSVTEMGTYVFQNCYSLSKVRWSAQLTTIPQNTFRECSNLSSITNLSKVTLIGSYAFYRCSGLRSIDLPSGLTQIQSYAFSYSGLTAVNLPDSLTTLENYAFQRCSELQSVILPTGITSIPSGAFYYCSQCSQVTIPKDITYIAGNAFYNVNGTFRVYQGSYADTWCKDNGKTVSYLGSQYRVSFETDYGSNTPVDGKAGSMVDDAYISAGDRITEPALQVEGYKIEGWYLDPEYTQKWDFMNRVMPQENVTLYAKWVADESVFTFDVESSMATITGYTGNGNRLIIPDTIHGYKVARIAQSAIVSETLESLTLPATVQTIDGGAFNCPNLKDITVEEGGYYKVVDGILYSKSGVRLVYAPQGRSYIAYVVPDGTTLISKQAFKGQEYLKSITIPDSVTSIAADAFEGNHLLTIYGSVGVCTASTYAQQYNYRYNVYTVTYYSGDEVVYQASMEAGKVISDYYEPVENFLSFGGWYQDSTLTLRWDFDTDRMPASDLNLYLKWDSDFTVTVSGSNATVTGYKGTLKDLIIPESINGYAVTSIAAGAFTDASIRSVTIPDCITTIASGAFHSGTQLIGNDASAVESYAAQYGLSFALRKYHVTFEEMGGSAVQDLDVVAGETVLLPNSIRTNYYFAGWYLDTGFTEAWTEDRTMPEHDITLYAQWNIANNNITDDFAYELLDDGTVSITNYIGSKISLEIPETINGYQVTKIGAYAFRGNRTLLTISIPDCITTVGEYAFADTVIRTLKWGTGLKTIEPCAFQNCSGLRTLDIPAGVESIGNGAFMFCSSLISVTLPEGLQEIGNRAFYSCPFLESVNFPGTLAEVGESAFANCPMLTQVILPIVLQQDAPAAFDSAVEISYIAADAIAISQLLRVSQTTVSLQWNQVKNAAKYTIYRKMEDEESYKGIKSVTTTTANVLTGDVGEIASFKVSAFDAEGKLICTSQPQEILVSPLDTPSVLSVEQKTASSATMRLNGVDGVDGYEIYRSFTRAGAYQLVKTVTTTVFDNTGLSEGSDYFYKVQAFRTEADGSKTYSNWSEVYLFHMPSKFMTAPVNVSVVQATRGSAVLTWDPVEEAEGYIIYRSVNNGNFLKLKEVEDCQVTNVGLGVGKEYRYQVSAFFQENGQQMIGPKSAAVVLVTQELATPSFDQLQQIQATTVSLSWNAVADADGYVLYRATDPLGTYAELKTTENHAALNYNLTEGTTYYYKVCAYQETSDGDKIFSNCSMPVSIQIKSVAQVGGLSISRVDGTQAKLAWTRLTGVDGYEIWGSANNENNYVLYGSVTGVTYTAARLKDGVTYYFKVRGYNLDGDKKVYGNYSDPQDVEVVSTPVLAVAEQTGSGSVTLMWSEVASADGYEIWRKKGSEEFKNIKDIKGTSTVCYGLEAGVLYSFKVRAYHITENGRKYYGFYSGYKSVKVLPTPSITKIERVGNSTVQLTWSKVTGASGYNVYRSDEINGFYTKIKSVTGTTVQNYGLSTGKSYYYKVVPYCTVGGKSQDGNKSIAKGIIILPAPKQVEIERTGMGTVSVRWQAVDQAQSYQLLRATAKNGPYTVIKTVTDTEATSTGLSVGRRYYYKVVACTTLSGITWKGVESSYEDIYLPNLRKPKEPVLAQVSETAMEISWASVTGAKGYEVARSQQLDGTYVTIRTTSDLSTTNVGLSTSSQYYYKVRPYTTLSDGTKVYGVYSDPAGGYTMRKSSIEELELNTGTSVRIAWSRVSNATAYNVYRSTSSSGPFQKVKTVTETSTINYNVAAGQVYYYKVQPVIDKNDLKNVGAMSSAAKIAVSNLAKPVITQGQQSTSTQVVLKWNAVTNAEGYQVEMAQGTSGSFSLAKTVSGTSATITDLNSGKTYRFRVRAFTTISGERAYSVYSEEITVDIMETPELEMLYQEGTTSAVMSWQNVSGADGYEVYRKVDSGSFQKLSTTTDTTVTDTGLTLGRDYSYRVRAYSLANGIKSYSPYGATLTLTVISYQNGVYPESDHPYSNNMDESWTYSIPGAEALVLHFSADTLLESSFDKLYITDANGSQVGETYYSGSSLAGKYIVVPGDTVNLRLTTDGSVTKNGFTVDLIRPAAK